MPQPPVSPKPSGPLPPDREPKGLSGLDEANLERTVIRRGLATPQEIEACKAARAKLSEQPSAGAAPSKGLLEVMIETKVITRGQAVRLLKETGGEPSKKFVIPGYEVIEKVGRGSMGVVYKARQTSMDRVVAVKILLESLAKNKDFIKRFEQEAKVAAKLSHNNIVNAIDAGQVDGGHYFVMEYVEGVSVKDKIEYDKRIDEKTAVKIIIAVTEALKHAHQRGLIHRDIKPDNIILTKDGQVKLADLGLARPTADEQWAMAEAGMAIGTPYYISPEQVRGRTDLDIRADIYGLGATFYHMVTGRVPYDGPTPDAVMRKHVDKNVEFVPPDHVDTRLSSGLGMVIETMMEKDRAKRYATPADLLIDLNCLLRGEAPIIASHRADDLAILASGDHPGVFSPDDSFVSDGEKQRIAAYVNGRHTVIVVLSILLGISMLSNLLMLLAK